MGTLIDLTGQTFHYLTVIKRVENNKYNKAQWLCKCRCGNEKIVVGTELRQGKVKSCGCYQQESRRNLAKDLTGQTFNYLTVLERYGSNEKGQALWRCKCKCGNEKILSGIALRGNYTLSCGCYKKEIAQKIMKEKVQKLGAQARFQDLTGQRFGKLLVLEKDTSIINNKRIRWICQCDCGNIKSIVGTSLKKGSTQSCGCIGNSRGQYIIRSILLKNNIPFCSEYIFSDLIDKAYLRFDFGIFDNNNNLIKLIEFDGRQHTDSKSVWHNETVIKHDKMKTEYCKSHHIPLLRISYKDIDKINLDMLLNQVTI